MSVALRGVPKVAATAWVRLRDELELILGDRLVAFWAWGSTVHPDRPRILGDLDTHVVVERRLDELTWARIEAALRTIAGDLGVQWDLSYTLAAETNGRELPGSVRIAEPDRREVMWAINRAHWLAGWFVSLFGPTPEELVATPTWPELSYALGRELEHLERHVIDGPHDGYEGRCAIFNGSRILHALETRNTALSKREGGRWALDNLPQKWHEVIRIADRTYDDVATPQEVDRLVTAMAPFVAMVRVQVPQLDDRAPDAAPRWSV